MSQDDIVNVIVTVIAITSAVTMGEKNNDLINK